VPLGTTLTFTPQLVLVTNVPGWTPGNTGNELVACTRTGTNTFIYALGSSPGGTGSGTWNYPIEFALRVGISTTQLFMANALDARASVASFDLTLGGSSANGRHFAAAMRGDYGWTTFFARYPVDSLTTWISTNAAGWKYIQCGTAASHPRAVKFGELPPMPETVRVPPTLPYWLAFPVEFEEWNVSDCPSASFGEVVTAGGGSNHYKLRYDGSQWRRVG
jgi:hypothetical protein